MRPSPLLITTGLVISLFSIHPLLMADIDGTVVMQPAKKKVFTIGSPTARSSSAKLRATKKYVKTVIARLREVSASHGAAVNAQVPALYTQDSADLIKARNEAAEKVITAALRKFRTAVKRRLRGQSVRRVKTIIPAEPLGGIFSDLPSGTDKPALRNAQTELSQMRAYNDKLLEAVGAAITDKRKVKPRRKCLNALQRALLTDTELMTTLNGTINSELYSTSGLSDWTDDQVRALDNGTYKGTTREIQQGVEEAVEVSLTVQGDTVGVRFRELNGSNLLAQRLGLGTSPLDCSTIGQGDLQNGLTFNGSATCGTIDLHVTPAGRLSGQISDIPTVSGQINNSPPLGNAVDPDLLRILLEGLILPDGTVDISSIGVFSNNGLEVRQLIQTKFGSPTPTPTSTPTSTPTPTPNLTPTPTPTPSNEQFVKVSAGNSRTAALLTDEGRVFSVAVIEGNNQNSVAVYQVTDIPTATSISCGTSICYALKSDQTLVSWTHDPASGVPVAAQVVEGIDQVTAVAAGKGAFVLALRDDASMWSWGANEYFQLGDGTEASRSVPAVVTGLENDNIALAAGDYYGIALKSIKEGFLWGRVTDSFTHANPQPLGEVGVEGLVEGIAAGAGYGLALLDTGQVHAWGELQQGVVPNLLNPVAMTAGAMPHFPPMFLKSNGTVWKLTVNSSTDEIEDCVQATELSNVKLLDAYDYGYFVQTDNSLLVQASPSAAPIVVSNILQ